MMSCDPMVLSELAVVESEGVEGGGGGGGGGGFFSSCTHRGAACHSDRCAAHRAKAHL